MIGNNFENDIYAEWLNDWIYFDEEDKEEDVFGTWLSEWLNYFEGNSDDTVVKPEIKNEFPDEIKVENDAIMDTVGSMSMVKTEIKNEFPDEIKV